MRNMGGRAFGVPAGPSACPELLRSASLLRVSLSLNHCQKRFFYAN